MRVADLDWMTLERYLEGDDRAVVPLGSTEQHAYLSLATDSTLAERVALEAAEPLGVPVFPVLPYGLAPYFAAYPGTVTLRLQTYANLIEDLLTSLRRTGFRRLLFVNGHGGNLPAEAAAREWSAEHPEMQVRFHHWWRAPETWRQVQATDPAASHASWMENFPWTRVAAPPDSPKEMLDPARLALLDAAAARGYLGDGSFGGAYQQPDGAMLELWRVAVQETRQAIEGPWRVGA